MTTPATLGERALRRLGVAVVPVADRPALSVTVSVQAIAERALQALGVTVTDADRPPFLGSGVPVADLAITALSTLGVIASDETPSAEDLALAESKVGIVHEGLVGAALATWAITAIPQAAADEYVKLSAIWMASDFGKTSDPAQIPILEARVKRLSLVGQAQSLAEARINAIHDELVGSANASWAGSAIPQAVSDAYVALTVQQMAPLFGVQAGDPAMIKALEARIRRFSMIQRAPDLATEAVMSVHQDLVARGKVRWTVFDIPAHVEDVYTMLAAYQLAPEFEMRPNDADAKIAEVSLNRYIGIPSSGERVKAEYF